MLSITTSTSLRIAVLMEMLDDVSRARDAEAAFRAFARRIRRLRPIDAYVHVSTAGLSPGDFRVLRTHRVRPGVIEPLAPAPDPRTVPVQSGGLVSTIIARREPQLYQDMKLDADPALGELVRGMGSCMAVPLFDAGRITEWWLMFRSDPRGYTLEDLEDDLLIGNLMSAITLHMGAIGQISALNAQLRAQFDEVARVQRALLPGAPPRAPGLRFAASYLTSDQAGGDYYDFFELSPTPPTSVGVLIADVSGHGAAAATVMAMLHATLHARPDLGAHPAEAMKFANARLAASSIEGGHVTAVFAAIDAAQRTLTIARAGHPLPRLRRADGTVTQIDAPAAIPMGILAEGYEPRETTVPVAPGETVVLYTDGIVEAENAAGEQLGLPAFDRAIAAAPSPDPEAIIASIHAAVTAHTGTLARQDDQTLVAFGLEP